MPSFRKIIITSLLSATVAASFSANAQSQTNKREEAILKYARSNGILAGGAKYCRIENDLLEEYIAKTNAQIAFMAADDYQKVLGRLEFKNTLTAASVKQPKTSCDQLIEQFKEVLRNSR